MSCALCCWLRARCFRRCSGHAWRCARRALASWAWAATRWSTPSVRPNPAQAPSGLPQRKEQEGTVVSPCMDEFLFGHMHRPDLGNGASPLACRPFAPLSPWPSPSAPTSPWFSCAPRHLPSLPAETDKWKKISYVFMPFCGIYAVFVGVKHMSHGHHDHEHVRRAPHPHICQARPSRSLLAPPPSTNWRPHRMKVRHTDRARRHVSPRLADVTLPLLHPSR